MQKGNFILIASIALIVPTLVAIYLAQTNPTQNNLMLLLGCGLEDMAFAAVLVIDEISEMYKEIHKVGK